MSSPGFSETLPVEWFTAAWKDTLGSPLLCAKRYERGRDGYEEPARYGGEQPGAGIKPGP